MATLGYRDNVYDRGDQMVSRLGTFWNTIFQDDQWLRHYYRGTFLDAGQVYLNYLEALATISRFECPVFHRENFYCLFFRESDLKSSILRYGDGAEYGDGHQYGVRAARTEYSITLPETLRGAQFMFNRIIQPSLTYTSGVDYEINLPKNILTFRDNPFDNPLVPVRNVVNAAGVPYDREAALWIYNGEFDWQYLWYQWGYALQAYMESSDYYKDFLNALADCYVQGPSLAAIQSLTAALTGVPIVREATEVVVKILQTSDVAQVVTDQHVYELSPTATIIVAEGDTLHAGDPLTDAFLLLELNDRLPQPSELPGFSFGKEFMAGEYFSTLLFQNQMTNLIYGGVDSHGKAVVTFEISGFPADIAKFWTDVHARGLAGGKVLADYLDLRPEGNRALPPTPANLPAAVNPLQLVLDNLMDNNLMLLILRPSQFAGDAPGVAFFSYLRRAMQPQTTYIVYVEIDAGFDYIDFLDSGLLDEEQEFLDTPDEISEDIPATFLAEGVAVQLIKEC